jgi:hypothetical protein
MRQTGWRINYADLTGEEWESIRTLHEEMAGRLGTFTFFDPIANLFSWSEEFERTVWVKDPFLTVTTGVADPLGGTNARLLSNGGAAVQKLSQRVGIPESYATAFSVWLRSDSPVTVGLVRGGQAREVVVKSGWQRVELCGRGLGLSEQSDFGIAIPPGGSVAVFGAQVEAQPAASSYKRNEATTGVYPKTRFASDTLLVWSDGPGRYRTHVSLESVLEAA